MWRTFDCGKPVFLYNLLNLKRTIWSGPELGAGKHTIVFDFKSDGPGLGKGGMGVLSVDGKEVARNSIEHGTPITFPEDETFDVGQDTRTPLALLEYRYDAPFKFTGTIDKLTFNLEPTLPKEASEPKAELGPMASPEPDPKKHRNSFQRPNGCQRSLCEIGQSFVRLDRQPDQEAASAFNSPISRKSIGCRKRRRGYSSGFCRMMTLVPTGTRS